MGPGASRCRRYQKNQLYTEALNTYSLIVRNKYTFPEQPPEGSPAENCSAPEANHRLRERRSGRSHGVDPSPPLMAVQGPVRHRTDTLSSPLVPTHHPHREGA